MNAQEKQRYLKDAGVKDVGSLFLGSLNRTFEEKLDYNLMIEMSPI